MRLVLISAVSLLCCKTTNAARQGGADFRTLAPTAIESSFESVAGVCFQTESTGSVTLDFADPNLTFSVKDGATNSVGRCAREIAAGYPFKTRPVGTLVLAAPQQPLDGWAVLDWVKLQAGQRFSSERGDLNPATKIAACLSNPSGNEALVQGSVMAGLVFEPTLNVATPLRSEASGCVTAVLASTAWPSPKNVRMLFSPKPMPATENMLRYFRPSGDGLTPLNAEAVSAVVKAASAQVGACWNETLQRRGPLGGAKIFRFRVDANGKIQHVWLAEPNGTPQDSILDRCLENVLKGLQFEAVAGEGLYTWNFASRS
jgi:hypothetical protein